MKERKPWSKAVRIGAITLGVLVLGGIIAAYGFRQPFLDRTLAKIQTQLQQEYQTQLTYSQAQFEGWDAVAFSDLAVVPATGDTLLAIEKVKVNVNVWKALFGGVQLDGLDLRNGYVQVVRDSTGTNFQAFLQKRKSADVALTDARSRAERLYDLLENLLDKVPSRLQMQGLELRVRDYNYRLTVDLNQLQLDGAELAGKVRVQDTSAVVQNWRIKGTAHPRKHQFDLRVYGSDTSGIRLPWIDHKYHMHVRFDSLRMQLHELDYTRGELHIKGRGAFAGMRLYHRRIASDEVDIASAELNYHLRVGGQVIELDSSSVARFNRVKFHPYLRASYEQDTVYTLKLHMPVMPSQDFISSLPAGLFTQVAGMKTQGNVGFDLDFEYNKNQPDSVRLRSRLHKDQFKILEYGAADLSKLNREFVYRAWDNGQLQRPITVGVANPMYTPLDQISPYLRNALLTTEDPSFFYHSGFSEEAFRQSIKQNIKTGRFVRGASTISMQLVKNVFLTREKTMGRKLEEILLVYLLENNRIVSKSRMYEVYLNIIEWGPNVYGIGEAAQFYFQKSPSQLNIDEALYLANIVPKPKKFAGFFQPDGSLRPWVSNKNRYLKQLMHRRGLLNEGDTLNYPVILTGRARNSVVRAVADTLAIDSLQQSQFDQLKELLEGFQFNTN